MTESSKPFQWWWTTYWIPLHIGIRIWLANRLPIMDCDEVYNYWEPLHFLLFKNGFQTWEYANEFALRTYAYLMPMVGLAKVYQALIPYLPAWCWPLLSSNQMVVHSEDHQQHPIDNKIALFLLLRSTLAAFMAVAEVLFCWSIMSCCCTTATTTQSSSSSSRSKTTNNSSIGETVGIVTSGLLLTSAGMSHASGALLPSSSITFLWLLGAAAFLQRQHLLFVTAAIVATLAIGWPFGVLLFVPIGVAVLVRERNNLIALITKIVLITVVIQATVMMIDYQAYQKLVSPTWNILMYNTKSGGDELYGVEPWTYYIKNLLLNFNYVLIGVTGVLPLFVLKQDRIIQQLLILLLPMYVWLLVVAPRPHKEERFLFPIYPCICLGAAMSTVTIVDGLLYWWYGQQTPKRRTTLSIQLFLWTPAAILSLSRGAALAKYYTAPLTVFSKLQSEPNIVDAMVCTCGEWYRFPSSFYLPSTIASFGFVESSFEGQLPQLFTPEGSGLSSPNKFNDKNRPEPGSHVSLDDCDYLIDLWTSDCRENDFIWKPIAQDSFLDAGRTNTLHRTLYLPFLHEQAETQGSVAYVDYVLYKRVDD